MIISKICKNYDYTPKQVIEGMKSWDYNILFHYRYEYLVLKMESEKAQELEDERRNM
jgi:hypothetical protein